ncbi:hypothetical protein S83_039807, partial [Arachis hypogaea]
LCWHDILLPTSTVELDVCMVNFPFMQVLKTVWQTMKFLLSTDTQVQGVTVVLLI